jgi:hypothetical protein
MESARGILAVIYLYILHIACSQREIAVQKIVESKRERMKKLNCLSIQREEKLWTYIRRREKENSMPAAKAGAQCRIPVPSPPPRHGGRRGRWGQARQVGAGEAGGGRRGWWGQARPMGAASHRPHARARQHQTLGEATGRNP